MESEDRQAILDTAGSVLWLFMDAAWMFKLDTVALLLIAPTAVTNLLIFRYVEKTIPHLAVTAAMNCWVFMNSSWMIQDVQDIPAFLVAAKFFFILSLLFLATAFISSTWRKELYQSALQRFRRFRLPH